MLREYVVSRICAREWGVTYALISVRAVMPWKLRAMVYLGDMLVRSLDSCALKLLGSLLLFSFLSIRAVVLAGLSPE